MSEEEHECTNSTVCIIEEFISEDETWDLVDKIDDMLKDRKVGQCVTALAQLLVRTNIEWALKEDGTIDLKKSNQGFTDLAQALRRLHDTNVEHW